MRLILKDPVFNKIKISGGIFIVITLSITKVRNEQDRPSLLPPPKSLQGWKYTKYVYWFASLLWTRTSGNLT